MLMKMKIENSDERNDFEDLWTEVCNIVQGVVTKTIIKKKKFKKAKGLSEDVYK